LAAAFAAAVACAPAVSALAQAPGAAIVATAGRIDAVNALTRIAFDVDAPFPIKTFALTGPDRFVVETPAVNFLIDPAIGRPRVEPIGVKTPTRGRGRGATEGSGKPLAGVVKSFRFGQFAPGRSRVVIDLAGPARIVRAEVEALPGGRHRLVVELAPTTAAEFAALIVPAAAAPTVSAPKPEPGRPGLVVDAGPGGVDDGAHGGPGAVEKDIVLDFAKTLGARLEATGLYKVVLTRASDVFIPLNERVRVAREAGAALFISIHADSLADEPQVAGATVYTVSEKASDAAAARLADKENQSDSAAGVEAGDDSGEVADILFDLTRRETRAFSQEFSRSLTDYLGAVARLNKNTRRAAGFRVLKAPDVPSVLLELGYLSSAADSANLVSNEWRGKVAGAVANAVARFFQSREDPALGAAADASAVLKASFAVAGRSR
jgi:N-acetylmuramoyl-L-alanine amidase